MGTCLLTGLVPLALGWLINWHMMLHPDTFPPLFIIGIAMLFVWGWMARNMNKKVLNTALVVLCQNAVGLVSIVLIAIQAATGAYWENLVGIFSQMYYIPVMYVSTVFFVRWGVFLVYFVTFVLMTLASFVGCRIAEK